jgi:hypothetical protein
MCEDFVPNFGDKRTGCCVKTTHRITLYFPRGFLAKNNMAVSPRPPYFSLFAALKIKLRDRHFDTIEVMEAELQAVLNTLTKWQKLLERCIHTERDYFEDGGGQ